MTIEVEAEVRDGKLELINLPVRIQQEEEEKRPAFVLGLHQGMATMSEDFNDPLPDSFWPGEDRNEAPL